MKEAMICVIALLAKRPDPATIKLQFNERTIIRQPYVAQAYSNEFKLAAWKVVKHDA